jgi:protein-glutamine gamma-glutamyltransferase
MNSFLVYRASFYLMLFIASASLSSDGREGAVGAVYTLAVAAAGLIAFFTVDRRQQWAIPRPVANALAVATLPILYFDYKFDENQLIQALGHWLVYLQLIKYFLPKTDEDDWFLFVLGLMQVLIGSVTNQSDSVGTLLCLWAMMAVWVLGQFFLQREARRLQPESGQRVARFSPGTAAGSDPYHGLFDLPYVAATVRVLVTTLALGGLIFLVLPRQAGATRGQSGVPLAPHLTGFDEEVQLGQLGEILENDSVVMSVELSDQDGNPLQPADELLWRGVTMVRYDHKKWHRQSKATEIVVSARPNVPDGRRTIRQKIKLEPNDSTTLFGLRPVLLFASKRRPSAPPNLSNNDGTLFRTLDKRGGSYDYEIESDADPNALQQYEAIPSLGNRTLLAIDPKLKERLRQIAEPVVAHISADGEAGQRARARALEAYLRSSGEFSYTLEMDVIDSTVDPVEDFLVNRKRGHCEYFASALALMLRSINIPSRVVNGFKGGDWSDLTESLFVRQKHAHSWVEAFVGTGPIYAGAKNETAPIWVTLDPTPALERQESIAKVGGIAGNFRPFTDVVRHLWVFYVVGYDIERQNRLVYAPMRTMITEVRTKYRELGGRLRNWLAFLFHFPDFSSFISIRGFAVSFVGLVLLAGVIHSAYRGVRAILARLRGPGTVAGSLFAGILFYRRLTQMLGELDLVRAPAETQNEFCLRAQKFLSRQGPLTQDVADVPRQVVDAFYRVRFGHLDLEPQSLEELDARLDALEACLKNP